MKGIWAKALLLASIVGLATARPALAYIDPSTGGMLFQLLAVIFASLSAILLIFSRQVRMLIARIRRAVRNLLGAEEPAGGEGGLPAEDTPPVPPEKPPEGH